MFRIFGCFFFSTLVLLVVLSPACFADASQSDSGTDDQDVQQLDEYVISDTRLPSVKADTYSVPAKITVITAQDIQKMGARTVQEALQYATGIVMYNEVGNAFEHRIDLRGFNSTPVPSISVFLDGMRVNEPNFNTINFDLIPFETIERIEIIPGPNAIFGQNTLGGTINIVTKTASRKRQVSAEVARGNFEHERFNINASGPVDDFQYYLNATQESETGFRDESGGQVFRFFGKFGYRPSMNTDVNVSYTYVKDRLSQAGPLPIRIAEVDPEANVTPGDFYDRENSVVRLNVKHTFPLEFTFSANSFYRKLQQASFIVGNSSEGTTHDDTESWGGTLQLSKNSSLFGLKNETVIGVEATWNDFGNQGKSTFNRVVYTNSTDSTEEVFGAFAQNALHVLPELILSGGLRFDQSQIDFIHKTDPTLSGSRTFDRVTPRAGVTYLVTPTASLYFTYSQGFRIPTVQEMFASGAYKSNLHLRPVRSNNFEIGGKAKIGIWGDVALAFYQSNIKDEIFFSCFQCELFDGINRNLEKTRRRGVEMTARVRPAKFFDGTINYTFTEAQFQNRQTLGFGGSEVRVADAGDTLPLVPKNRLSIIGNFYPVEGVTVSIIGLYVSSQFLQNDEGNNLTRLPGYFVLNGKASYQRQVPGGILKAFLQINNLLNSEYFTRGIYSPDTLPGGDGSMARFVVPAPGIAVFGGISYQFSAFPG